MNSKQSKRRKVSVECLFCGKTFESKLRWEGIPEDDYCSKDCEQQDEDLGSGETYEKFSKGGNKDEWW